jgi:hypothetical protein
LTLATVDGAGKRIGVLLINLAGPGTVTLTGLPGRAKVDVVTSDAAAQEKQDSSKLRVSDKGDVTFPIAQESIVTLALSVR